MTYHVKCGRAACDHHVRAPDAETADEWADRHEARTGHAVAVIPDAAVRFERASERVSDDPVGDETTA